MYRVLSLTLIALLAAAAAPAQDGEWVQLFNGKDLEGWTPKIRYHEAGENYANTFRVEDGVLKVAYDGYERFNETFGHLFYEKPFSNYHLRVEYRFTGEQMDDGPGWAFANSGLMLHGQSPESMAKDQEFPASIEVQLLADNGSGNRSTANLCTPSTNVEYEGQLHTQHCTNSSSKTYPIGEWVTSEVIVEDGAFKHIVNGETVLEYSKAQYDPNDGIGRKLIEETGDIMIHGGTISLQSESHPVEFRKVEIMELDK